MVDYKVTKTVFGERPKFDLPNSKMLDEIGEDGIQKMMDDFYDLVIESEIANFFPQDEAELEIVKIHNGKFFIEACGGKPRYTDEMGHVDMIKMHEMFSIPEKARVEWLGCFEDTLRKTPLSDEAIQSFWDYIEPFSKHLVNTDTKVKLEEELVKL